MANTSGSSERFFRPYLRLRPVLFGLTVCVFFSACVRWYLMHEELRLAGALDYQDHFYPPTELVLLPLAAFVLCFRKTWCAVVALLLSGHLVYEYGLLPLLGHARAHDDIYLSYANVSRWWRSTSAYQPQEIFYLCLASIVFSVAAASSLAALWSLAARLLRRPRNKRRNFN